MGQQRRLWITVSDELHSRLDALESATGVSRSVIVERVLMFSPELVEWAAKRLDSDGVLRVRSKAKSDGLDGCVFRLRDSYT